MADLAISDPASGALTCNEATQPQSMAFEVSDSDLTDGEAGTIARREQRVVQSKTGRFAVPFVSPFAGPKTIGVIWLHEIEYRAMEGDEKEVMRLLEITPSKRVGDALEYAARHGHFGLLKAMVARGLKWTGTISTACVRSGNLEMLDWVYAHFEEHLQPYTMPDPLETEGDPETYHDICEKARQFYDDEIAHFASYHQLDSLRTIAEENGFKHISAWLREKNLY